ncbi:MAG: hypothetical protein U0X92_08360 [Anaerolineales bacterium]
MDEDSKYEIKAENQFTRCGWTPFEGWQVKGRVRRVVLRGQVAFDDGKVLAEKDMEGMSALVETCSCSEQVDNFERRAYFSVKTPLIYLCNTLEIKV